MPHPVTVPRLGWNMDEGTFGGWLKRDGDQVAVGDPLFSLEGDKAVQEIEALDSGVLRIVPDGPQLGDRVVVGAVLAYVLGPGEKIEAPSPAVAAARPAAAAAIPPPPPAAARPHTGAAISPRARRRAQALGVDWTGLAGTGRGGRIRERDVLAAAEQARPAARAAGPGSTPPSAPLPPSQRRRRAPAAGPIPSGVPAASAGPLRRAIAARLLDSHLTTAPVTLTTTADAESLVSLRRQCKAKAAAATADQAVPSYGDVVMKLAAMALAQHPQLNARWENERLEPVRDVHVGLAVDTQRGLLVPVVRDVARRSLWEIARQSAELAELARAGRLTADQMQGGTFTITNLGAYGIDAFTPIVNPPQTAILGLGRIVQRPVVRGDRVLAGQELTLSLTFDHRAVDGAPAARFLQALVALVENPAAWLIG